MELRTVAINKLKELEDESRDIDMKISDLRKLFDTLINRRTEIAGAVKEITYILNVRNNEDDTENESSQRTDIN